MRYIHESRSIPVKGRYDVLVAGGGVAGIAAALSAKREGKSVLLLEKNLELGGLATLGQINFFVAMDNGRGIRITRGMCDEFVRLSTKYGYDVTPEEWSKCPDSADTEKRYTVRYSASMFALALLEILHEVGVELLFDTIVSEPVMEGGHCCGVIVENKGGRFFYEAGIVVDATGDADILYRAGVPTRKGINYFTYFAYELDLPHLKRAVDAGRIDLAVHSASGGNANLWGARHPDGVPFYAATTGEEVTRYVVDNQLELLRKLKDDDRNTREIINLPGMCQIRTSRCIEGDYVLKAEDCFRHFDDSITAVNDYEHRDFLWEIPYRCLVRTGFDNLITAGRTAAGDGFAWDVIRAIPGAILTGQTAGLAAAQALETGKEITEIDIPCLQKKLGEQKVLIHFEDDWIPDGVRSEDILRYTKLDGNGQLPWLGAAHDEF